VYQSIDELNLLLSIFTTRFNAFMAILSNAFNAPKPRAVIDQTSASQNRDAFGINKLALGISKQASKLLGFYSINGHVVWELYVPGWHIVDAHVIKSAAFGVPECIIIANVHCCAMQCNPMTEY
jgi:hypothetical protein